MFPVQVLQRIFLVLTTLHTSERSCWNINPIYAPQLFPLCKMCPTCFRRCQVLCYHAHAHVHAIENHMNSCRSVECGECTRTCRVMQGYGGRIVTSKHWRTTCTSGWGHWRRPLVTEGVIGEGTRCSGGGNIQAPRPKRCGAWRWRIQL